MDAKIFRVNYKSDFILTLTSDAGWLTPFCIKFWTGSPRLAYYASYDGETFTHCTYNPSEPTKLTVQFDDHHLPIGDLKYQVAYHFTVADFPENTEDEVTNQANVTTVIDGDTYQVMLDLNGETAPEIQFALPAYANELQRIQNEQTRIAQEQQRVSQEQTRINQEAARVTEFNDIVDTANNDHERANEDHSQALEDRNQAAYDHLRANHDHNTAASDHLLAFADRSSAESDHLRAVSDHTIAESDHSTATADHETATADHIRAESDHSTATADHDTAVADHTQAASDHTRAESDHQRVETDLAEVEEFSNSLGPYDISAAHATGSTLATYPDLATALGQNGSNIPEALRKGGMSVKYVQTYDNNSAKYVQYFLTKNEWSASKADWEKMNLEEEVNQSGQEIDSIGLTIDGELDNPRIVWQRDGYFIAKNGAIQSDQNWKISAPIFLKAGVTVVVKTQGQACTIIASTVDGSSYTPIIKTLDVTSGLLTYSYCPVTDETIAISAKTGMGDTSVSFYTYPLMAPVNGHEKDITPNGAWDWSITGKYITPQGIPTNAINWGISYPLVLKKGQTITIGTQGSGACVIAKPTDTQNYEPLVNIPRNTTGRHEYSCTAVEDITIVFAAKYGTGDASVVVSAEGLEERTEGLEERTEGLEERTEGLEERTEGLENSVVRIDTKISELETHLQSYSNGCLNYDGSVLAIEGWYHNDEYIPVSPGDRIVWNPGSTGQAPSLIGYDSNKQKNHYWAANAVSRTITALNDMAYVRCSFVREVSDGQGGTSSNDTPISVGDKVYKINYITQLNNFINEISVVDDTHGIIGNYYPEEVKIIENQLRAKLSNRFQFLHISDNHGLDFGYAQEFLDYCQAKFLVNTGDMVANTFADLAQSSTIELAQEPTKPVYLILGNHDYVGAPSKAAVFNAFVGAMNEHNGTSFDKSYYSIDYATEGIKAIFLDGYDGWDDSDYATLQPGPAGLGKMSQAQINWFASELQDANTNSLHVVIFIHEKVGEIDRFKNISDFYDTAAGQTFNLPFLVQMVDAFLDGTSCSFEYNGNPYSFTFSGSGHFVAWIGGHYHGDICGWITGHERQFVSIVCRPFRDNTQYSGSYDRDKLGVHFNFCTIDTVTNTFSVYRVGQQSTIYGTPRIAFSIKYL